MCTWTAYPADPFSRWVGLALNSKSRSKSQEGCLGGGHTDLALGGRPAVHVEAGLHVVQGVAHEVQPHPEVVVEDVLRAGSHQLLPGVDVDGWVGAWPEAPRCPASIGVRINHKRGDRNGGVSLGVCQWTRNRINWWLHMHAFFKELSIISF